MAVTAARCALTPLWQHQSFSHKNSGLHPCRMACVRRQHACTPEKRTVCAIKYLFIFQHVTNKSCKDTLSLSIRLRRQWLILRHHFAITPQNKPFHSIYFALICATFLNSNTGISNLYYNIKVLQFSPTHHMGAGHTWHPSCYI